MIYVMIIVCAAAVPTCDVEHAVWAQQSAPIFDDADECFADAKLHLAMNWDDIDVLHNLGAHRTVLICTEVGNPA